MNNLLQCCSPSPSLHQTVYRLWCTVSSLRSSRKLFFLCSPTEGEPTGEMENFILEIAGPAIIGGASFGISNFFNISNIDKRLSKEINTLYFCAIPVFVYVIFRLYFSALFRLTSVGNFSESRPRICKSSHLVCHRWLHPRSSILWFFKCP